MERVITFNCMFLECGRKFETEDLLEDHVKRRHSDYYNDRYQKKTTNLKNEEKKFSKNILGDLEKKIEEIEKNTMMKNNIKGEDEIDLHLGNLDDLNLYQDNSLSEKNFEDDDNIITDEMLLLGGKFFQYDEIDEIDLEQRNLKEFINDQDVDFSQLKNVLLINLSKNCLKSVSDLKFFVKLLILDISNNMIEEIFFVEELPSLNIFNAENNKITSISSLVKCKNLEKLYLNNNDLKYQMSSLKTLNNLPKLAELSIKENKFLKNTIGYKYTIIRKCKKLIKLDDEEISTVDRDIAKNFEQNAEGYDRPYTTIGITDQLLQEKEDLFPTENFYDIKNKKIDENSEMVHTIKITEKICEDDLINEVKKELKDIDDNKNNDQINDKKNTKKNETLSSFPVKDKISELEYTKNNMKKNHVEDNKKNLKNNKAINSKNSKKNIIEKKENDPVLKLNKLNLKENPYKKLDQLEKEIEDLKWKNAKLIEEKKSDEIATNLLKSQLENMDKLNKEYETIIENLKFELEKGKDKENSKQNLNKQDCESSTEDDEKSKLKEQLNFLRKDYYDLLYEYSNSKVEEKAMKFGMTSVEFIENKRPKSSFKRVEENDEYNKTVVELKNLRESQMNFFTRKNELDDEINQERDNQNKNFMEDLLKEETIEEINNKKKNKSSVDHIINDKNKNSSKFVNKSIKINHSMDRDSENEDILSNREGSDESDIDSLEELVRKSYMNLNEITSEIKSLNQQTYPNMNKNERGASKKREKSKNKGDINLINSNINKINRLKSKEKISINEDNIQKNSLGNDNISSDKISFQNQNIGKINKNLINSNVSNIGDKNIVKKPIIFNMNNTQNPSLKTISKPIIKKDIDSSFVMNSDTSIIVDSKENKKISINQPGNPSSSNTTLKNPNFNIHLTKNQNIITESKGIGPTIPIKKPALTKLENNNTNESLSNFSSETQKFLINRNISSGNSSNQGNNSSGINLLKHPAKITLGNREQIDVYKASNSSFINEENYNFSHLRSDSTLSENSSNSILNNINSGNYNKIKDYSQSKNDISDYNTDYISNISKNKIGKDNSLENSEINLKGEQISLAGFSNKNFSGENEKILISTNINSKIGQMAIKKPPFTSANGTTLNKPVVKSRSDLNGINLDASNTRKLNI